LAVESKLVVRPMQPSDVSGAAQLHLEAFPGFFLSALGPAFLREFYRAHLWDAACISQVAVDGATGKLVGVVVGTVEPHGFYSRLAKHRWHRFAIPAGLHCIRRPRSIRRVVRGLRYRGHAHGAGGGALLSSICVSPTVQGQGVGARLIGAWSDAASLKGASAAYLTTDALKNDATIGFYLGQGWSDAAEFETPEGRRMKVFQKTLVVSGVNVNRPRALHVVAGDAFGGASRIVESITVGLSDDYEVHVAVSEPILADRLEHQGLVVHRHLPIDRAIAPVRDAVAVARYASLMRTYRYDLVHTHTSKGGVIGRLAAALARVPCRIHTVHNFAFSADSSPLAVFLNRVVEYLLARVTTSMTTVSHAILDQCATWRLRPRDAVICIPNGIPDVEPLAVIDKHPMLVVYHGRLAEGKGLQHLLLACRNIVSSGMPMELAIFGSGELAPDLERLATRFEFQTDIFRGFVDDLPTALAQADVCVQPSLREGMSVALLEAMRARRCIVASDIPANMEVLGSPAVGLTFAAGDPEALERTLRSAISDPDLRAKCSNSARRRFVAQFVDVDMVRGYRDLYVRCLGGSHAS
jgi:glycosyltransferase involved in cell wall biosynthesis/GNAT superfamily N-acetyltransferase